MSGRYGRRGYGGGTRPRASRWMALRYAGVCKVCGVRVPAGSHAFYDGDARTVTCDDMACAAADGLAEKTWIGSPTSGQWVDTLRAFRVGSGAVAVHTFTLNSGAVLSVNARGRCEDAPCCGCCS